VRPHELHNLAVLFRVNSPDIGHCTTLDAMNAAGLGYAFGLLRGTPERYTTRRALLRESIANKLEQKAGIIEKGGAK